MNTAWYSGAQANESYRPPGPGVIKFAVFSASNMKGGGTPIVEDQNLLFY